jgi:hypothetical protein
MAKRIAFIGETPMQREEKKRIFTPLMISVIVVLAILIIFLIVISIQQKPKIIGGGSSYSKLSEQSKVEEQTSGDNPYNLSDTAVGQIIEGSAVVYDFTKAVSGTFITMITLITISIVLFPIIRSLLRGFQFL